MNEEEFKEGNVCPARIKARMYVPQSNHHGSAHEEILDYKIYLEIDCGYGDRGRETFFICKNCGSLYKESEP